MINEKKKRILKNIEIRKLKRRRKKKYKRKKFNKKRNEYLQREAKDRKKIVKPKIKTDTITHTKKIKMPTNFSVVNNTNEVVGFFYQVLKIAKKGNRIYFDLSGIKNITPDAILYMRSVFDYFKEKYKFSNFSGNAPQDIYCKNIFINSGWYDYVQTKFQVPPKDERVLSIESNQLVIGLVAKKVIDFSLKHLNKTRSSESRSIYNTLIECMTNTKEHAYKKNAPVPSWYLMALFNEKLKRVSFAFIDGGLGIPSTIRKNRHEKVIELFKKISPGGSKLSDSDLITSALKGEFRTRTKKGYRGRGLPKIHEYAKKGLIDNFTLVSNKGYINIKNIEKKELSCKFIGTLFSWDILYK